MTSARVSSRIRTNRTYSLLGTCALLAITVIQLPKAADLLHELRARQAQQELLLSGTVTPHRSPELDQKLEELRVAIAGYEEAMIGVGDMPSVQSELMELARESGCKLRKSVGQSGSSETWLTADQEGLEEDLFDTDDSPYQLTTEQLALSLEGTLEQTFHFLGRIRKQDWLLKLNQISFSRTPDGDGRLAVELNIAFYELTKHKTIEEELMDWGEGPPPEAVQ